MRAHGVVVASPAFDQYFRLLQRMEDLAVQQLVAELRVEALVAPIFPGTAGLDEQRPGPDPAEPVPHGDGGELAAIVRPDVVRRTTFDEEIGERLKHVVGLQAAGNHDRQALPGELVDHRQHPDRSAIMGPGSHDVIGPDMVGPVRPQPEDGAVVEPQAPRLGCRFGTFSPSLPPDPLDPLGVQDYEP